MKEPRTRIPALLSATLMALAWLTAPAPAAAQELSGLALGPDGAPLPRTPVVLHRVGGDTGPFVATDTTNEDGRFAFVMEPADSAVHFAALRYEGQLYIGPAIRSGAEAVTGYTVSVDPANEAGVVASALSGQAGAGGMPGRVARPTASTAAGSGARSDAGAYLLVGLLALTASVAFFVTAPRYRRRRTRDALIELAAVENALESDRAGDERARLEADRDRLRSRLAPGR